MKSHVSLNWILHDIEMKGPRLYVFDVSNLIKEHRYVY